MDAPAIELTELEYGWPGHPSLLSIGHLAVQRGEKVILTGPSGCGKSTLLALIGGVLKPRSGTVRVLGTDISAMPSRLADRFRGDHIGFIFQQFNLLPYLSVQANVTLPLEFSRLRRERLSGHIPIQVARDMLANLWLSGSDLLIKPAHQLSVGQQQRVAAARALLGRPELLIADEPTSALDADARADFLGLLMNECQRMGTTLLLVSHDRTLAPLFDRSLDFSRVNEAAPMAA